MSSESSPDPKKSGRFRRMTRRTSSMLSFGSGGRSGTPGAQSSHHKNESSSASEASDSRRTSIDRQSIDIPPAPPTATDTPSTSSSLSVVTTVPDHISKEHTMPSAIPESPMREAAANEEEALLHGKARVPKSSLSQVVTAAQSPPQDKAPAPAPAPDAPEQRQELPPPVIVTEPSKFTTEPDQMSTHSPAQPSASAQSSLPVIQTTSDPAPQPPSQPSEPSARPAESHGSTDILEPLPPAQPRTTSDSYFDPRDIPVESFHAQSDPHNIKRLKEEINKNTIGESPSSSEGQTNESNEDKQLREATSPEDIVTPRPHGPGDMENVNVYISGPTAVQPKPAQPVPAAPVQPAQPKPVQPAGPVQLAQPKPVQPAAPVQPAQSVKPVQPAVSVQPAQSVQPVQPAVPVQPASAGPAPTMPVPMTASPAAPVEVPATAVVTTELKRTIEGSVKIPEAVVLPSPDTHVQPTGPESGIREIVQTDIKKQDDVASASENEDPFADPVVPIQISAQPSSEPDHGQEEIPMPQYVFSSLIILFPRYFPTK
ncbi:hypothetical protein K435DRAFT_393679 [Dendrothele bispora CBS 962.96]|uniref:Uncharacterized protein n=1 Tax=Dendrothele bispora (strain CBS 962.96) TaxID=1314807 RepID=A0A4S8L9D1_DENBC|nr:hypothetical protein K435DRAFT_393679 [Dendrothele bispora CBS 962.96]